MNKSIKKIYMTFLISFGLIDLYAQSNLIVKENSGNNSSYTITNIRKLTITNGNLNVIDLSGTTNSFGISTIKNINFTSIRIPTSILNEKSESEIQLYPNPIQDYFNLESKFALRNDIIIEIIDIEGDILKKQISQLPCRINISELKSGIYICRLYISNQIENFKIIKQ